MDYMTLKNHPRLMELHFIIIFEDLVRAFGIEGATKFVQSICDIFRINYSLISGVIAKQREITAMKFHNLHRYRQELFVLGLTLGYSKSDIASKIMKIARQTFYVAFNKFLDVDEFLTDEWVSLLEHYTVVLGLKAYSNEVYRFLNIMSTLKGMV